MITLKEAFVVNEEPASSRSELHARFGRLERGHAEHAEMIAGGRHKVLGSSPSHITFRTRDPERLRSDVAEYTRYAGIRGHKLESGYRAGENVKEAFEMAEAKPVGDEDVLDKTVRAHDAELRRRKAKVHNYGP
jgi:hypothetical protein